MKKAGISGLVVVIKISQSILSRNICDTAGLFVFKHIKVKRKTAFWCLSNGKVFYEPVDN
jgi:hypothetical protein